jgi:CSLREA domain-containing protein
MRPRLPRLLLALALIAALVAPAAPARAQSPVTLTVNTLTDEWSTGANAAQTKCSLREALQATVTNSPAGNQGCGPVGTGNFASYTFAMMPGTYVLTLADELPNVTKKIRIDGNNGVKIDGNRNAARFTGIFTVGGGELILEELKLQNGRRPVGGALWIKSGIVRATKVEFFNNIAFSSATVGDGGAAIVDTGEFYCTECRFVENKAAGNGGAVRTGNTRVLLDKSEFLRNEAQFFGGAVAGFGGSDVTRPRIFRSLFRANKVFRTNVPATWPGQYSYFDDSSGGGTIYNFGNMVVEQSQIVKSTTERSKGGGAIYNQGTLTLIDVAISGSQAIAGGPVPATIGGAILNQGSLDALRVSLHANEATRGGGIMNGSGRLNLVNSNVAQNRAQEAGGLSNGYKFTLSGNPNLFEVNGGDAYVFLSTLVRNDDNAGKANVVDIGAPGTIYMGNSITDAGCTGTIYTYGGNTFVGVDPCTTFAPDGGSDTVKLTAGSLKLEGLADNGGVSLPEAGFLSVKPGDDSPAVDLGRAQYCTGLDAALQGATDQVGTQRPQGDLCDAGALEVGVSPPEWTADPTEDEPLVFPVIFATQAAASERSIEIGNKGGGKIAWEATLTRNDGGVFSLTNEEPKGELGKDDTETVTLRCAAAGDGTFYGALTFSIDQPEEREIVYNLVCSRRSDADEPVATPEEPPAPRSAGKAPPGGQSQTTIEIANQGSKPLNLNLSWADPGVAGLSVAPLGAAVVAAGASLAATVTCAPDSPGLFTNTLQVATNDPAQPSLSYPIACEGGPNPDPEPVSQQSTSQEGTPRQIMGLAISPDGTQLLAGHWEDAGIARYSRGASGLLSLQLPLFSVPGMTVVTGIRYSGDGRHVYYSSSGGDGVVAASRDAAGLLTATQTITSGSELRICGIIPGPFPILDFCPIGTMDGARALDISPDDGNLYVTGYNDDSLTVFRRNATDGRLGYLQSITGPLDGATLLDGIFGVLASPDGKNVYVASQNSDAVVAFTRRPENGVLRYLGHVILGPTGTAGGPTELALSPDGRFLYVASTSSDSVHILARNPADGFLTPQATVPVGVDPYHILIGPEPDGPRLLVALWNGDAVKAYRRDAETGAITPLAGQADVAANGPVFLVASPDDRDVYAALFEGRGVTQLRNQRPVPAALSLSPAAVTAGAGSQTLTVRGQGFAPDSRVFWNGAALATTYVSATRLDAAVPANLVASAGSATVFVRTPPGGGGDSSPLTLAIQAAGAPPVPAVSGISPDSAPYGGEPLTLTVTGSGFTPQSRALLNGVPLATTYLNPTTLLAELTGAEIGAPGPLAITVVNDANVASPSLAAAPASAPARFAVAAPGAPATPAIGGFSPASLAAGGGAQWVTVRGQNFSRRQGAATVALWGGEPRESLVLDANTLQLLVTAEDLAAAGAPAVTLYTPGAGVSEARAFPVLAPGASPVAVPEAIAVELTGGPRVVVSGEGFVAGAQIRLNGVTLTTAAEGPSALRGTVTLAQLRQGGTLQVVNPGAAPSEPLLLPPLPGTFLPLLRR